MVPVLPFTLAQLFFVVNFRTPINDRPKQVKVRIERPGREPFIVDNSAPLKTPSTPSPDANFYQYQTVARIAPFEIDKEGIVRVFVEDELGDNYAGGLRLKVGIHPELGVPQVALGANLIVGHYKRLANCPIHQISSISLSLMNAIVAAQTTRATGARSSNISHPPSNLDSPRLPNARTTSEIEFFPRLTSQLLIATNSEAGLYNVVWDVNRQLETSPALDDRPARRTDR